jgi:hypothetical protein
MLLRLFKGTGPGVIFLIIISLIIIWTGPFLIAPGLPLSHFYPEPMPLYGVLKMIIGNNALIGVAFSFSIVSLMSFLLVNFNTKDFFINERTFLPALVYILLGGLFPECQTLNPVLPASLFLILAIRRIMDGYRKPGTAYNFFDAGILISTGSLFYGNLLWFGLLVIIGIALLRTGNIGEIAISVLGLLTPYFITFGLYYVIGKDLGVLLSLLKDNLLGKSEIYLFSRLTIVVLVFTGMIVLVSLAYLVMRMNAKKIKSRQTFWLLIWGFLISAAAYIFLPSASVELIWIAGIPVSYFITHYFVFVKKKIVPEIFLSVLFVLILLIQIWYLKNGLFNH